MEGILWYLCASSRGGPTRVRIVRALDERPRNANQLAEALDPDYTTVRHHLDVLREQRRPEGRRRLRAIYLFTDQIEAHWEPLEEILETVDPE